MLADLGQPVFIHRPIRLKLLAETLAQQPVLAVDTESNSLYAYREQVCLLQFSTPQADYVVDPLALKDLSPLGPLFANPRIEKVFHAAEYDLICLKRDFGFEFANLFDTMVAARTLGREALGLGSLLEEEFGVTLDKRYQRANWGQRPLPPDLLAYARLDTHYLIQLRDVLHRQLQARTLLPLALEDFTRGCQVNGRLVEERGDDCWRISGAYDLSPQQAAVLQELCRYRDQAAQAANRPLFKVMSDKTLLEIAHTAPATLESLARVNGMTKGQLDRHGRALLEAIRRGQRAAPLHPPRSPRPDERYLNRLEALRRWRKQAAEQMQVQSDVVLPRDLLYSIAEQNPRQPDSLAEVMSASPWRLEHFGSQILEVLS